MLGTSPMPERSATRTGPLLTGASPGDLKAGGDERRDWLSPTPPFRPSECLLGRPSDPGGKRYTPPAVSLS